MRTFDRSVLFGVPCGRPLNAVFPASFTKNAAVAKHGRYLGIMQGVLALRLLSNKISGVCWPGTFCTHIFYSFSHLLFLKFVRRLKVKICFHLKVSFPTQLYRKVCIQLLRTRKYNLVQKCE